MSDQVSGGLPAVTAGEIIRDGWAWVTENKKPLALFGLALIAYVIITPILFFGIASQFMTKEQTSIEPSGFIIVLLVFLGFGFFLSFLWFIAWIFQSVLGIRGQDRAALKAKFGPLKIALRSLIFAVVIFFPIGIAAMLAFQSLLPLLDPQTLLTLFSSVGGILGIGVIFLVVSAAYTSYYLLYIVGSVVKESPGLFDSLKISHQHFILLFKFVFILCILPFLLELPEQFIQASRVKEFMQNPDAGVPIVETSRLMIIISSVLDLLQLVWFLFGCICSAIAYKKIVGLPDLPTSTDAQTTTPV